MGKDIKLVPVLESPLYRYAYRIAELAQNQARIKPFLKEGYNDLPYPFLKVCGYNTALYEAFKTVLLRIPVGIETRNVEEELHTAGCGLACAVPSEDSPCLGIRGVELLLFAIGLVILKLLAF
jgi:hypothetical protein